MLRAFDHPVATSCDILGVVDSNVRMVKLFVHEMWMFHDVRFVQQCCARVCALVQ